MCQLCLTGTTRTLACKGDCRGGYRTPTEGCLDGCVSRQWVCGYYWIEASVSTVPHRNYKVWVGVWVDRAVWISLDKGECVNCVSHGNYRDSGIQGDCHGGYRTLAEGCLGGCVGRQRGQWVCGYYWIEVSVSTVSHMNYRGSGVL